MACFVPYRPDPHRRMPWTCPRFRGEKCYRTFSATAMWESWWCALVNTDEVASATQHADAGPCASCGTERPVAIAGATQSSEERIRTTEEQRAEVDGMRDFQDAIVRFVSLPRCQGLVSRPIVKAKKVEAGISEERFCDVWHVCRLVDR